MNSKTILIVVSVVVIAGAGIFFLQQQTMRPASVTPPEGGQPIGGSIVPVATSTPQPQLVYFTASPQSGPAPLTVDFSIGHGSGLFIDFGDGTPPVALQDRPTTCPSSAAVCPQSSSSHAYSRAGTYTATLYAPPRYATTCPMSDPHCAGRLATVTIKVTGSGAVCPNIGYSINCVQGYHAQTNYDSNGCEIQPTCTPN